MMSRATLQADVRNYVTVLGEHMGNEEREIFPRLAALLREDDWFLVNSGVYFAADPIFGDSMQARFKAIHRQIASLAGCGCTDPAKRCAASNAAMIASPPSQAHALQYTNGFISGLEEAP